MNLKEQLRILARKYEQKTEDERREEERRKVRSQEDWELIEKYLRNLFTQLASSKKNVKVWFRRFIPIECSSNYILFPSDDKGGYLHLKDGKRLEITNEDMKRFCNQHNLKLRYFLDKDYDYMFTNQYKECSTSTFLIGI